MSERMDKEPGTLVMHVPGVGLVRLRPSTEGWQAEAQEPLSPAQQERLALWLEHEWPQSQRASAT